jgi:hypothetical protein
MKPGSVIVDLAGEQGGNCELTEPGRVVVKHGVTIVGYTDLPSRLAKQSSTLYATNLFRVAEELCKTKDGVINVNMDDDAIRGLTVIKDGSITWPPPPLNLPAPAAKPAAKPAPAAQRPQAVPFAPGEILTYDISWSSFLTAGTATLTVKEKKPSYGSEAYYIVAEGRPTPLLSKLYDLYYKADTLLDVYSLLPQRGSIYSEEGKRHRMKVTTFDQARKKAQYEVQTRTLVKKDLAIPAYSQDALGALYVLRAIPLKAGDKFSIPICDAGQTYKVQMNVGAVETVKTGIGAVPAWKVTPVLPADNAAAARRLTLWVSDDARKLPVRMQAQLAVGSFDLTLKSAGR